MSERKRVTIRDVAQETGLALSTVSNALAGKNYVSDETRELVLKATERLGYRASVVARVAQDAAQLRHRRPHRRCRQSILRRFRARRRRCRHAREMHAAAVQHRWRRGAPDGAHAHAHRPAGRRHRADLAALLLAAHPQAARGRPALRAGAAPQRGVRRGLCRLGQCGGPQRGDPPCP